MMPFLYPPAPHVRLHGPYGYDDYESYRSWLRDEFLFRCVYCLKREQWSIGSREYSLDHFLPQTHFPEAALDYENLLYACLTCNLAKGKEIVPNPCDCMLSGRVTVYEDGSIEGTEKESRKLIRKLALDDPEYREFRSLYIGIVALARAKNIELYRQLMKYPDDLPDLSKLRPVGNSRPEGIHQSCFARRERGELPETY